MTSIPVEVKLPQYEGPLMALVKVIVSGEVDVFTIRLAELVDQVVDILLNPDSPFDSEDAGSYLVMCATLLRVKSRRLLPVQEDDDEEVLDILSEDDEEAAIRCLAEYQHYQAVASMLEDRAEESSKLFPRGLLEIPEGSNTGALSQVSLLSLVAALEQALASRVPGTIEIATEQYSLRAGLDHLRALLVTGTTRNFLDVFPKGSSRLVVVVVFLGLLELIRLGEITVREHQGMILVCKEGGSLA